ncbi:hypothetical protein [Streptomyces sasae]|uniref:hypothetical protein n=1 Tax=Streptomyces sasae TaxID=1266772 RepID=UPI00292EB008|nr:hypothetical protein [Streptomyces sasae]
MQLVITSRKAETLDRWQHVFEGCDDVVFQRALRAETPVDAVLMAGIFAIERYGSRHDLHRAQILENHRGDGWHDLIIVPPTLPMTRDGRGGWKVQPEYEGIQPAYYAASRSFRAISEWNDEHEVPIAAVEVNLPMLDMDRPVDDSSPRSFRQALEEYRERP